VHAVVWNFAGLPMTVDRCLPVLQPICGVCLFGANEMIYLNQSAPSRGICLNSCAEDYSKFPLSTRHQHLRITLDGCSVQTLITPNDLLVVLRSGDLYILSLVTDQANVVREMHLTKIFGSVYFIFALFCFNFLFIFSFIIFKKRLFPAL
jgi:cleavage and polyadenylation specificity factor subunit 1